MFTPQGWVVPELGASCGSLPSLSRPSLVQGRLPPALTVRLALTGRCGGAWVEPEPTSAQRGQDPAEQGGLVQLNKGADRLGWQSANVTITVQGWPSPLFTVHQPRPQGALVARAQLDQALSRGLCKCWISDPMLHRGWPVPQLVTDCLN